MIGSGPHQETGLAKIRIDLPSKGGGPVGESFWAEPIGGDLYRLRNTPFYAFDLHFGDVVRATPKHPGELPTIHEVVERSGHNTLRVMFAPKTSPDDIAGVLEELVAKGANHEHARGHLYAIDVRPHTDFQGVCDYLWRLEAQGVLSYETGTSAPPAIQH